MTTTDTTDTTDSGVTVTMDADELENMLEQSRHTLEVDAAALIAAIRAVLPHTEGTDDLPALHRIRVAVGQRHVELLATSHHTAVVARVADRAVDVTDPDWSVDLFPGDLATVAKMFKPGKDEQITLRLDLLKDDRLTVTDASGLIEGRAFTIPTIGTRDTFPDVRRVILDVMDADRGIVGCVTYTGALLKRFADSAAVYKAPLIVEPTRTERPFVVTIGEQFVGLLVPAKNDDVPDGQAAKVRDNWRVRLNPARRDG